MYQRTDEGFIELPGKVNQLIDIIESGDWINGRIVDDKVFLEYCKEWVIYFNETEYIRDHQIIEAVPKEFIRKGIFKR